MSYLRPIGVMAVMLGVLCMPSAAAEEAPVTLRPTAEVSINDLITDTQFSTDDPDRVALVWWLPDEFWEVSLASDPTTTKEGVQEVVDVVSKYTLAVCVDGELGPFGGVKFVPPGHLRSQLKLINAAGEAVDPLNDEEVSQDMLLLIGSMRPVLGNMLGPMGQNMAFIVFPRQDSGGQIIADATQAGSFTMKLNDLDFDVQTPLPSLLKSKYCGTCEREFRGDYSFCPYDRADLNH